MSVKDFLLKIDYNTIIMLKQESEVFVSRSWRMNPSDKDKRLKQ